MAWQHLSGLGDRLSGLVSAFHFAVQSERRLEVRWRFLDDIFEPTDASTGMAIDGSVATTAPTAATADDDDDAAAHACRFRACRAAQGRRGGPACIARGEVELVESAKDIRSCATEAWCAELVAERRAHDASLYREDGETAKTLVDAADSLGCPLRAMLRPRQSFLDMRLAWFQDGAVQHGTLRQLATVVRGGPTVAMHARTNDATMRGGARAAALQLPVRKVESITRCLEMVSAQLHRTRGTGTGTGTHAATASTAAAAAAAAAAAGHVRWLVASDHAKIREHFREAYPTRTIMLMDAPQHLAESGEREEAGGTAQSAGGGAAEGAARARARARAKARSTFAEWYLLGLADELVTSVNKRRVSAFSKFAWLYSLRSQHYAVRFEGHHCLRKEFEFDGNTYRMPRNCTAENPFMGRYVSHDAVTGYWKYQGPAQQLPQPHLPAPSPDSLDLTSK